MIRQTSLLAFWSLDLESLNRTQRLVLESVYRLGLATDWDVAYDLGLPINCVTPRRGELEKLRLIRECGFVRQKVVRNGRSFLSRDRTQYEPVIKDAR